MLSACLAIPLLNHLSISASPHLTLLNFSFLFHSFYEDQYDDPEAAMDYDPEADLTLGENGEKKPNIAAANGIVESGDPAAYGGGGVANSERITTPYMTKYERARILGTRALQIS